MSDDREYQEQAVDNIAGKVKSGNRRIMLVSPTGSGKTHIASMMITRAVAKGSKTLFVAHRRELIEQCYQKLIKEGVPARSLARIVGGKHGKDAQVNVASIQTLTRRDHFPAADLIFIDEAHRSAATSYQTLIDRYPNAVIIGMTATPERLDKKGFDAFFDDMVEVASVPDLISQGFLIRPDCYVGKAPELSAVSKRGGDYDERELAVASDKIELIGDIYQNWRRIADGMKTAVFAVNIEHADHIAAAFRAQGVTSAVVSHKTPGKKRDALISDWKAGKIAVLCSVALLVEGFDYPQLECVIMARPTKSLTIWLQAAGRVMRIADGKHRAVILDHAGCVAEHGLPSIHREWTLCPLSDLRSNEQSYTCQACGHAHNAPLFYLRTGFDAISTDDDVAIAPCPACRQAYCPNCKETFVYKKSLEDIDDVARVKTITCPGCASVYAEQVRLASGDAAGKDIDTVDAELELVSENSVPDKVTVLNTYKKLLTEAHRNGYRRGWVYYRLKETHGYDDELLRTSLPRHTADWWRAQA
jgi:DNA repair protein RadD